MSTLKIKRENGKIFCPLADSWHIETPEEKVRQEYIKILVEDYGYSLDQMAQEIKVNNSQRGQGKARADIVIWKSKQDKIESKAAFINFESGNGLTMLVGNNGSGKSNVLEAISGIFHDLFKGKDSRKIKCDYKLQYTLNEINCVIEQTNGFLRCYGPKFKRREYFIEENAPHNIIGLLYIQKNQR